MSEPDEQNRQGYPNAAGRFVQAVWVVTRKDLLVEARTREILYTTAFFAVACVLVFAFGFVREGRPVQDAAAGILWISIAFSGTLALGRAFERERQGETLRALLIAPIDRSALYLGKLLGILILLAAVEMLVVPLVALMFQAALFAHALLMPEADEPMARAWLAMLVFFDVVFVTLALWTFEPVMTE